MQPTSLYSDPGNGIFCVHTIQERFSMPSVHVHVQYEYLFIRSGTLIVENNTDRVKIKDPCVIIHRPYTLHRAYTSEEHTGVYDRYITNFKDNIFEGISGYIDGIEKIRGLGMSVIKIDDDKADYLAGYFEDMIKANINKQYRRSVMILSLITDTLIQCMDDCESERISSRIRYINELLQYISENLSLNLTLEELADRFFISRAKLVSDFRSVTGMSVKKYVTLMRINTAMTMLRNGISVTETAEQCGFCDDSHFIITFKKYTNMTPKEFSRYRKSES